MTAGRCPREGELLDALGRGYLYADIAAHAQACRDCSELRIAAEALLHDRAAAVFEAPVPSAATMWWRIQLRRRREAQSAARRSLIVGQAATLAIALLLVAALLGTDIAARVREVATAIHLSTPLLLALTAWILAVPIAGWVAIRQK